jgi:hypothetical protein
VTPALAQREVALGAVALLGAIVALALASPRGPHGVATYPQPVPAPGGGWYTASAGMTHVAYGRRTKCGVLLKRDTRGVIDPVLPCNARIYVAFGHSDRILTQVVDKRPVVPGRRFDLTPALAQDLDVQGIQRIKWAYAR